MHFSKKSLIAILLVLTALTFSNSLGNGFVGDDEALFIVNNFYHSWENFPRLFSPQYSTHTNDAALYLSSRPQDLGSGSVAYRPVLSATFFIDYGLWGKNPFGYHLTNLLLHLLNTALVFGVIALILRNNALAFMGAALFALHPVRTEAVCSIGYRADMVACLFVLLSVFLYIRYRTNGAQKYLLGSLFSFFLAVFSKESAVVTPLVLIAYDFCFVDKKPSTVLRSAARRYLPYFFIAVVYVFLYLKVFPNSTFTGTQFLGGTLISHVKTMAVIFGEYLWNLLWPFSVRALPPLYRPPAAELTLVNIAFSSAGLAGIVFFIFRSFKGGRIMAFFLFWFLLFFIPVANIVPLPNPMAHRFLYLPSVGFFAALAVFLEKAFIAGGNKLRLPNLKVIGQSAVILGYLFMTFPLNFLWKSNAAYVLSLVKNYPDNAEAHFLAGLIFGRAGEREQAAGFYERALELGSLDPRLLFEIGLILTKTDPARALKVFDTAIELYPGMPSFYTGAARVLLFQGEFEKALSYSRKSLELAPDYLTYGYTIQALLLEKRIDEARGYLREAEQDITNDRHIGSLRHMFDDGVALPVDIGF